MILRLDLKQTKRPASVKGHINKSFWPVCHDNQPGPQELCFLIQTWDLCQIPASMAYTFHFFLPLALFSILYLDYTGCCFLGS